MASHETEIPTQKHVEIAEWWRTGITELQPNLVRVRGYPIEQVIGGLDFASTVWLMLRGNLPTPAQARLLEAALVASVDHGPLSPSAATVRMAATCGVGLNAALASAIAMMGDHHAGAGQQSLELLERIAQASTTDLGVSGAIQEELNRSLKEGRKLIPGYGKHQHTVDPRAKRLLELLEKAVEVGTVEGKFLLIATSLEQELKQRKGRAIPMNIDGATALVLAELGFPPPLARGLFILGRMVGLLAHAHEEMEHGSRNKSPIPRGIAPLYDGPPPRNLPIFSEQS